MPTVFIYGEEGTKTTEKVDVSYTKLPFLIDWMDYKAAEKAKAHMQVPVKVIRIPYGGK